MILEGIVTTQNADGTTNIAPMGPIVAPDMSTLRLRPFRTATTFANLQRTGQGIFHVTDDVLLIAQAAVGTVTPQPALRPATDVEGMILADACRWYAFRVSNLDASQERSEIDVQVVATGRQRDFWGFNRAKHAVLEGAILATRLHLIAPAEVDAECARLALIVQKTAGPQEFAAWEFVAGYIHARREA